MKIVVSYVFFKFVPVLFFDAAVFFADNAASSTSAVQVALLCVFEP